ncbi:MAG: amidohydrolase [Deltaproteobacteria bacterium HGW-Deltaproteobacteria-15]|jgi:imidazolonepropionase-like amidohydrolase|nr:MAG: amidohydrolase [Deltaproteobacteria bacterium HGW-Deltaproteobacteria-15]
MLAVINGTIYTMTKGVIRKGTLLIEDGRIAQVGKNVAVPKGAEIYDARGKVVMPGLVDAHCHTGIFPDGVGWTESDGNEMTDPVTPHLRALDAIHPEDMAFRDLREAGITTINTGPGSANLIGGQFVCLKTRKASTVEEMVLMAPSGMKMALGENPKRTYGERKTLPSTRMGNAAQLRSVLQSARNYLERLSRHKEKHDAFVGKLVDWESKPFPERGERPQPPDPFDRDIKMEALIPVLEGNLRAMIHSHRADDIMTAIRISEEFGLRFSIEHATEGYKIADILAAKNIPCVVGPIFYSRMKYELRELTPRNPGILSRAGVKVAIQTDEMSAVKYLRINAALAVQQGMKEEEALKAITIYPAEIIGVAERIGSLEKGKDADLIVLSGHPLDYRSVPELVLIEGERVYEGSL